MGENNKNNKLSIKKSTIFIVIVVFVVLLFAAVFCTKLICDNINSDLDRTSKWGMTVVSVKDSNCEDFHSSINETNTTLTMLGGGTYGVSKLGESCPINFANFYGETKKPLKLDCTGKVTFPEGAFVVNGVFSCPIEFDLGLDEMGDSVIVKGLDYIGQKEKFEAAISAGFDKSDRSCVASGTDLEKESGQDLVGYRWTYPQDCAQYFGAKDKTFNIEIVFQVSEITSK